MEVEYQKLVSRTMASADGRSKSLLHEDHETNGVGEEECRC